MRLVRLAACTAATALLTTAAGAGSASAAATKHVYYRATTDTGVVQLVLTLPSALALPGVPNPAVVTLLGTDSSAYHGMTGSDVATSHSYLAGGSLITDSALSSLLSPLNRTITASLTSPGLHTATAADAPTNPLGLGLTVGSQSADTNSGTRLSSSNGTLTAASLGSLRSLGLAGSLDSALATLTSAVSTVTSSASTITTALGSLPTLPSTSVPNPLAGVITGSPSTLSTPTGLSGTTLASTITTLPAQVSAILDKLLDGAAVSLGAVSTRQQILPSLSSVASIGSTDAADIDLFGGLVQLGATKASVTATAATTKSAATSGATATLLNLKISTDLTDLVTLVASDKGLTAGLLSGTLLGKALDSTLQPVVEQIDAALNTVLAQLTSLLSSLNSGAKLIQQGTTTTSVSTDGHTVSSHATPAQVTIGLPIAPDLLTISLGKADAESALSVVNPTVVTPPTVVHSLPRTGGSEGAALIALLLVLMAGGAVVIRRRHS